MARESLSCSAPWRGPGEGDADVCSCVSRSAAQRIEPPAGAGGFRIALTGGVSGSVASARAAVAPARDTRAGLAAGLTNAQLAGQRVIASYPGLTPPASLFTDISNGQVAGVIFFGENISSQTQIAQVITQLRQAQAQSPVQVPLLLMTDQEGGLVRRLPGQPTLSEKQIGQSSNPVAAATAAGTKNQNTDNGPVTLTVSLTALRAGLS